MQTQQKAPYPSIKQTVWTCLFTSHIALLCQDYFCCTEYKEYKVLVAVCMRQMVERMRTAPPDKIVLKPCNKIAEKKQLEVKALLM